MNGFEIELMLAGWRETHNGGFTVTFIVPPEGAAHFKSDTAAKNKLAGQIYMAVFVRVDEAPAKPEATDWKPLDPPLTEMERSLLRLPPQSHFPGGLCGLAVRWCGDDHFIDWVACNFPAEWRDKGLCGQSAKEVICEVCKIDSRKQLDTAIGADRIFRAQFLEPYAAQRKADGIDEE